MKAYRLTNNATPNLFFVKSVPNMPEGKPLTIHDAKNIRLANGSLAIARPGDSVVYELLPVEILSGNTFDNKYSQFETNETLETFVDSQTSVPIYADNTIPGSNQTTGYAQPQTQSQPSTSPEITTMIGSQAATLSNQNPATINQNPSGLPGYAGTPIQVQQVTPSVPLVTPAALQQAAVPGSQLAKVNMGTPNTFPNQGIPAAPVVTKPTYAGTPCGKSDDLSTVETSGTVPIAEVIPSATTAPIAVTTPVKPNTPPGPIA